MPKKQRTAIPTGAIVAYAIVALGVVMAGVGVGWKQLIPAEAFWSDEQRKEYDEAYHQAHAASIGPGHAHAHGGHAGEEPVDVDQAKARFQQARQDLERAQTAQGSYGKWISIAGVLLAVTGAMLLRTLAPSS